MTDRKYQYEWQTLYHPPSFGPRHPVRVAGGVLLVECSGASPNHAKEDVALTGDGEERRGTCPICGTEYVSRRVQ